MTNDSAMQSKRRRRGFPIGGAEPAHAEAPAAPDVDGFGSEVAEAGRLSAVPPAPAVAAVAAPDDSALAAAEPEAEVGETQPQRRKPKARRHFLPAEEYRGGRKQPINMKWYPAMWEQLQKMSRDLSDTGFDTSATELCEATMQLRGPVEVQEAEDLVREWRQMKARR
jgi:hypothetical protein